MWKRLQVSNHPSFAAADSVRDRWLSNHPTSSVDHGQDKIPADAQYKVRVKRCADEFDFIVWTRKAGA